jgi:hypothetical protein
LYCEYFWRNNTEELLYYYKEVLRCYFSKSIHSTIALLQWQTAEKLQKLNAFPKFIAKKFFGIISPRVFTGQAVDELSNLEVFGEITKDI